MPDRTQLDSDVRPVDSIALTYGPVKTEPGVLVHSRRSREAGAETWLILAAPDTTEARREWAEYGVALLRCDLTFTAVRIPADIFLAAAGTTNRDEVADYLSDALDGGPCFFDGNSRSFYVLTPLSTGRWWDVPDTELLSGGGRFLGVPATTITEPDPRCAAYWVVPMGGPAALCDPGILRWLVQRSRIRLSEAARLEAGEDA
ncbi:hypothetical protein [Streptomyces roseolus]|uniref:hypothetical protein n=1 Tax=Streptomyces roseolus TaxID=67358 RepID=UPI0036E41846